MNEKFLSGFIGFGLGAFLMFLLMMGIANEAKGAVEDVPEPTDATVVFAWDVPEDNYNKDLPVKLLFREKANGPIIGQVQQSPLVGTNDDGSLSHYMIVDRVKFKVGQTYYRKS